MRRRERRNRTALLLALSLACACGGDGGSDAGGGPLLAAGSVTGFGSLFVGGTAWRLGPHAAVEIDGRSAGDDGIPFDDSDVALGAFVRLEGTRAPDGSSGLASRVRVDVAVQGPIAAEPQPIGIDRRSFPVLGRTVVADEGGTVFEGSSLASLREGLVVEVSGPVAGDGTIRATRIVGLGPVEVGRTAVDLEGVVADPDDDGFALGSVTVTLDGCGPSAPILDRDVLPLEDGDRVEVEGVLTAPSEVGACRVRPSAPLAQEVGDSGALQVEGVVEDFSGLGDFALDGIPVDASTAALVPDDPGRFHGGALVQADGVVVKGILRARVLELREGEARVAARVAAAGVGSGGDAPIVLLADGRPGGAVPRRVLVQVDAVTRFEDVRGGDAEPIPRSDLAPGDLLEVRGVDLGSGRMRALVIQRREGEAVAALRGRVASIDDDGSDGAWGFTVLGVFVELVQGTTWLPEGVTVAEFLEDLSTGDLVEARDGDVDPTTFGVAAEVAVHDGSMRGPSFEHLPGNGAEGIHLVHLRAEAPYLGVQTDDDGSNMASPLTTFAMPNAANDGVLATARVYFEAGGGEKLDTDVLTLAADAPVGDLALTIADTPNHDHFFCREDTSPFALCSTGAGCRSTLSPSDDWRLLVGRHTDFFGPGRHLYETVAAVGYDGCDAASPGTLRIASASNWDWKAGDTFQLYTGDALHNSPYAARYHVQAALLARWDVHLTPRHDLVPNGSADADCTGGAGAWSRVGAASSAWIPFEPRNFDRLEALSAVMGHACGFVAGGPLTGSEGFGPPAFPVVGGRWYVVRAYVQSTETRGTSEVRLQLHDRTNDAPLSDFELYETTQALPKRIVSAPPGLTEPDSTRTWRHYTLRFRAPAGASEIAFRALPRSSGQTLRMDEVEAFASTRQAPGLGGYLLRAEDFRRLFVIGASQAFWPGGICAALDSLVRPDTTVRRDLESLLPSGEAEPVREWSCNAVSGATPTQLLEGTGTVSTGFPGTGNGDGLAPVLRYYDCATSGDCGDLVQDSDVPGSIQAAPYKGPRPASVFVRLGVNGLQVEDLEGAVVQDQVEEICAIVREAGMKCVVWTETQNRVDTDNTPCNEGAGPDTGNCGAATAELNRAWRNAAY